MLNYMINIINIISPFIISIFVLYVCIGWVFIFFKCDNIVTYLEFNGEFLFSKTIYAILAFILILIELGMEDIKPGVISLTGVVVLILGLVTFIFFLIFYIIKSLKKYRDTIKR